LPEIKENAVLGIWIVCLRIGAGKGFRFLRGLIAPALMLVTAAGMAQQVSGTSAAKADGTADVASGNAPAVAPEAVLSHEPGTVIGTVKDANGNVIEGAAVTLRAVASDARSAATADANGFFHFSVEPGEYVATVSSPGLTTWTSSDVTLGAGDFREIADIVLKVNSAVFVVRVTPRRDQIAEEQIHAQEQQRVGGILPNFYVSYVPNAAPLTTRQKFELAWKNSTDLGSFSADAITAGLEQVQNSYPAYHQGVKGYARRLGAAYGNDAGSTYIGAAILPTLFRQDPRYFWRGTGSVWSRALYSISTIAICKGDNGRWEPNYSFVLGNLASGALSNVYYPAGNRGWGTTLKGGAISSLQGIGGRLLQEFVMRRVSRGVTGE
jgi:hypothetical protein